MVVKNSTDAPTSSNVGTQGTVIFAVGATITDYQFNGVPGGQQASAVYVDNETGVFWLTCGVRNHGGAGMWAALIVSSNVTTPYVVVTNPTLTPSAV